ncbi:MAG TPA: CAP domain-containing protein [Mycobacteriales bacterium]|nr:CAP domain-containing protein [Mycobacteriales bacterium]
MTRRLPSLLAALVAATASLALVAPAAHAGPGEGDFLSRTNGVRSSSGLRGYASRADLVAVARRHAQRMASQGRIFHNSNLGGEVDNWQAVGENVGMGGDVASIHQAFMNSSSHRSNIVDRDFTEVGMGTATDSSGRIFVAQVFRQPQGASAPAPQPAPKPAAAPKPAPRPAAAPARPTAPRPTRALAPARTLPRRSVPVAAAPRAVAPAVQADPAALLRTRLVAARHAAGAPAIGLEQAVVFDGVMTTLAG